MNYDKEYDVNGIVQYDAATELLTLLSNSAKRVLDIGCGSGRVTKRLQEYTAASSLIAIDQSQQMIDEASKSYQDDSIKFIHCSIEEFANSNEHAIAEKFDLITSNSSFQWFRDHSIALRNIHAALSPNGVFVVQTPYKANWCPTIVAMMENFFSDCYPELKPFHRFPCMHLESTDAYSQLFQQNGFIVNELYSKEFHYDLSSSDFVKVFKSGAYKVYSYQEWFAVDLPADYSERLLDYVEDYTKGHERISISMPRVFARVSKSASK